MELSVRPIDEVCLVFRNQNHQFFSIERIFGMVIPFVEKEFALRSVYLPYVGAGPLAILKNILFVRRTKATVFHVTGDTHYAVLGLPGCRTILTIHDCVFLHRSNGIKRQLLKLLFLKWPVHRAGYVTTISEATKSEIIRYTNCPPEKIVVIPNAADARIKPGVKAFNAATPVLLFIGITPNKNMERVIEAVKGTGCRLRIIGQPQAAQLELLESSGILFSSVSGLSDGEMAREYSDCDIVLFPSLYEGFGLPVLEGQMAGKPVVTSNISPMKEVGGSGVCQVNPLSVSSIREGIEKVMTDSGFREQLIAEGFVNVQNYKPESVASRYISLYREIIKNEA